ncbi:MAG: hypothetical protein C5B58_14125 [Acidobacteria bacterium]|nr:MAG: hypothetical protein C5B58_14125 [Acidobacteriota bacterium]
MTLVSGLKLARKKIYREPLIELIGVDPNRFAEIRSLGLINEQIDWKQRFFIPTDKETGVPVLTDLLARYPVMVSDDLSDEEAIEVELTELTPPQIVNLDDWVVPIVRVESTCEPQPQAVEIAKQIEQAEVRPTLPAFYFARRPDVPRKLEEVQLALDFG